VRAWASVNGQGKIVASSGGARIVASVGADQITWPGSLSKDCIASVTVASPNRPGGASSPALADASLVTERPRKLGVLVSVYTVGTQGAVPSRVPYAVAVICPVPRR
jgi:hypothetical protein